MAPAGTVIIGVLMKKEEKEKKKDNQYKIKKAMAIAIGLMRQMADKTRNKDNMQFFIWHGSLNLCQTMSFICYHQTSFYSKACDFLNTGLQPHSDNIPQNRLEMALTVHIV